MKVKFAFLVVILLLSVGGSYWFFFGGGKEKAPIQVPSPTLTPLPQKETSQFGQFLTLPKELTQILPESFVVSGKLKKISDHSIIIEVKTGKKGEYQLADSCKIYHIERGNPDSLKEIKREDLKEEEETQLTVEKQENSYYVIRVITGK